MDFHIEKPGFGLGHPMKFQVSSRSLSISFSSSISADCGWQVMGGHVSPLPQQRSSASAGGLGETLLSWANAKALALIDLQLVKIGGNQHATTTNHATLTNHNPIQHYPKHDPKQMRQMHRVKQKQKRFERPISQPNV